MKTRKLLSSQDGIAHLGLIVLVVVVVAAGLFAFSRVKNANQTSKSDDSSQSAASSDDDSKSDEEINKADDSVANNPITNEQGEDSDATQ